jgi:hypothetical protein
MKDIRKLVQQTLDDVLAADSVRAYWLRKAETGGENADEYVVYTVDGDPVGEYADDKPLTRSANVAIRYYYRDSLRDTIRGRKRIHLREKQIESGLEAACFSLPNGYFDSGDIDDIGFGTTIFDCEYWRVV